jgi:PAS domain S-box-containing protein
MSHNIHYLSMRSNNLFEQLMTAQHEKAALAKALNIANSELLLQLDEKGQRAAELFVANIELAFQSKEKAARAAELILANIELDFQNDEKQKRTAELAIANIELNFQNLEKEKRAAELMLANVELDFQNLEKDKRATELVIANKELLFQSMEKEKGAAELVIANTELVFQREIRNLSLEKEINDLKETAARLLSVQMDKDRLEHEYNQSQNRFKAIFEQSSLGNNIIDKDLQIIKVNKALIDLFGYSENELLGSQITDFVHPDYVKDWLAVQHRLWALKQPSFSIDTCIVRKDKTSLLCQVTSILLSDNDQTLGYSIIQDISHRKELERMQIDKAAKFYDLNSLKNLLIGIMAHDLRSPLSTLRSLFDLLLDNTVSQEEVLDMLPQVVKKLNYTSEVLDTTLSWINSQMGNFESSFRDFFLYEVIKNEVDYNAGDALRKGITINCDISPGLMAFGDPNANSIVIRNLISNAIKFSKKNDMIEVIASQQDTFIVLSVKDTGVGITPEQKNQLFKGKVESKKGTGQEFGTGIGLLLCKDLVEKAHGTIWVTSEIDNGSVFSFTIPAVSQKKPNS